MSALPAGIRASVEREARPGRSIVSADPVTGGCINHGLRVRWDDGERHFLKWNASAGPDVFAAEADGLTALRSALATAGAEVAVPEPLSHGAGEGGTWLLCAWVEAGGVRAGFDEALGSALARLHSTPVGARFGWERDNWIGALPQDNGTGHDWAVFWRRRRIEPQLVRARRAGLCPDDVHDQALERLPALLADPGPPSLLHGDLWSGNTYPGADGVPVLVDPAVYRGHGEVDLAMTELFGGFGHAFYEAYASERGIDPGYREGRRDAYQLYYLMVHVNLFGRSYEAAARTAAQRIAAH